jgi:sporulation protein YlmC with PRC-barrel domain
METSRSHARNVSSDDVEGATIYDDVGKKIGKIDHLIIEKMTGKVL